MGSVRLGLVLAAVLVRHAGADVVTTVGATFDARATGPTWSSASTTNTMSYLGGGRVTLGFEPAPPVPEGPVAGDVVLVPELLTGVLADDVHAEGMIGAGARLDLRLVTPRARAGFYGAARGLVIGGHQDGALEMVIGTYVSTRRGLRVGLEGGAIVRPRRDEAPDESHELDAVMSLYVGH